MSIKIEVHLLLLLSGTASHELSGSVFYSNKMMVYIVFSHAARSISIII